MLPVRALVAPAGWAARASHTIPLPDDFQPESIAVGARATFYVGSLNDGDIYRGTLSIGRGRVFIDVSGRQAAGLKVDRERHLLFVAGGFTGHGDVYSTVTALDQALGDRPPDPTGRTGDGSRRVPATERTTTPPTFIPRMPVGPVRRQPV